MVDCLEYQLSLPLHRACYYIQTRHGEKGKVGSNESVAQQHTVGLCSVLGLAATNCKQKDQWPPFRFSPTRQSWLTVAHWSTIPVSVGSVYKYLTADYRVIKAEPASPRPNWATDRRWTSTAAYSTLGGTLWSRSQSRSAVESTINNLIVMRSWLRQALVSVQHLKSCLSELTSQQIILSSQWKIPSVNWLPLAAFSSTAIF